MSAPAAAVPVSTVSPEFRLLIACSWIPPASASIQIARLCAEVTDWHEFLALVTRHQVPSLAYRILAREQIPDHVRRRLKELSSSACTVALHTAAELARLGRSFAEKKIAVMPLKGVMLSIYLFGDPATRHPGDLDLMVKSEDFDRAGELLESLGYKCDRMKHLLRIHNYECSYWNPRLKLLVDLHWAQELWTAPQVSELWTHSQNTSWMGVNMRQLQGDALLLFLCDHGARHKWSRIKWLSDVAMLLSKPRLSPWSELSETASRFDLERPLAEAVQMVQRLYGIELPHEFRSAPRGRKVFPWRIYLNQLMIQPEDLKRFPLPNPLVWLYYPLRPLFWCWRHFKVK